LTGLYARASTIRSQENGTISSRQQHFPIVSVPVSWSGTRFVYWLICHRRGSFLQIDVDRQSLAVIQMSEDIIPVTESSHVQALRTGDGGLGFAVVSEQRIQLWGRTVISGHVVRGVLHRTVELEQLLSLRPSMETHKPSIVGYDEDSSVIFLWTAIGVFMIQLESMKFTKVSDDTSIQGYFPFTRFYTAGNSSSLLFILHKY